MTPVWPHELITFPVTTADLMRLSLEAWDKDLIGKTVLGSSQFSLDKIIEPSYDKNSEWAIPLSNKSEYSG